MNPQEIQQKIAEYFEKLSPEAQKVFASMEWLKTLEEISEKYKLNNKQIETLGTETMLVLLGIIDLNEYEKILITEINLPRYSMDEMIVKINENILKDIRPKLMEAFEKNNQEDKSITNEELQMKDEKKEEIKQALDSRFSKLTQETQDIIAKLNYPSILVEVGKKYGLTVVQMGVVEKSVVGVVLGTINTGKFEETVKELQLGAEKNEKVVNEINDRIFKKIREELVRNVEKNTKSSYYIENEIPQKPIEIEEMPKDDIKMIEEIESPDLTIQKEISAPREPNNNYELKVTNEDKPITNDELRMTNKKEESILSQKLSGAFKIPKTETEHSLMNMTKSENSSIGKKIGIPKVDPYREPTDN